MLTQSELFSLLPLIVLGAGATLLLLSISFTRHQGWNVLLAIGALLVALFAVFQVAATPRNVTELMVVDHFACFFMALMITLTIVCIVLAHGYLQKREGNREEMYLLMILSLIGGVVLASSSHFASLFIGLEILSVPLYALVAYTFRNSRSLEAGIKYLLLSATGSAMMLLGMALIYAYLGTLSFTGISQQLSLAGDAVNPLIVIGSLLIVIAFAFKLSLAPFHLWTPDVYEGAPAPVSAFIATVAKIAVAAVLVRFISHVAVFESLSIQPVLVVLAILSMLVGNVLAMTQNNIKRLLAYSSIAHFGYWLVGVIAVSPAMRETSMLYILVYALTTLAAFGVVSQVSSGLEKGDADNMALQYRGLYWRQPLLAIIMTVAMLSMAGIPLTAGFIGKFYLVIAGINTSLWWLLATMVIGSAIGIYYYLRVIIMLYQPEPENVPVCATGVSCQPGYKVGSFLLLLLAIIIILAGVYPQPVLDLVRQAGFL